MIRTPTCRSILFLGCLLAVLGLVGCRPTRKELELKMTEIEKRQNTLDEKLAALDRLAASRKSLFPVSRLWITSDRIVYRTAIPEEYSKGLTWVVLHNGKEILGRSAIKEMKFDPSVVLSSGPGTYTFYLSTWLNEAYMPISNVVSFYVAGKESNDPDRIINSEDKPRTPSPEPSPTATQTPGSDFSARIEMIRRNLQRSDNRLAEYDAYVEQQKTLPRRLTIWMDEDGTINRSVGPDDIESTLVLVVSGRGHLSRNERFETQFVPWFQGAGLYRVYLTSSRSSARDGIVSNEVRYSFKEDDSPYGFPAAVPRRED